MAKKATGHVRLRPNGTYEAIVSFGVDPRTGKRVTKSRSATTKDQAEALKKQLLASAKKESGRHSRTTVAGLLEEYVAQYESTWTPETLRETKRIIDKRLVPAFGNKSLARLSAADIDRFYREMRKSGRRPAGKRTELPKGAAPGLSEASVRRFHVVLHAALELGVRWELLPTNPAARATLHGLDEVERDPVLPEEALRLLSAADAFADEFGAYIRISAASGARRGELCGLLRGGVDREGRTLMIRRVAGYGADGLTSWERTKTRRKRLAPIGPGALAILERHLLAMEERALRFGVRLTKDDYVWSPEHDCSKPYSPDSRTARFIKIRDKLGLTHVRLQDLRHFAGSTIVAETGNQRLAQEQLGHRHLATTDRYVHVVPAALREAADKLDDVLSGKKKKRA